MTFPADYVSQVAYLGDLVTRINELNSDSGVIVVQKTTEPTQLDFVSRWLALGHSLPIEPGYEFHWYDGTKLRGVYGAIDDGVWVLRPMTSMINSSLPNFTAGVETPAWGGRPAWSPIPGDERLVYSHWSGFTGSTGNIGVILSDLQSHWSKVYNVAGTDLSEPEWKHDASKLVFGSGFKVCTVNLDGSGYTELLTLTGTLRPHSFCWRNNGYIVFAAADASNSNIFRINENGTGLVQLTALGLNIHPHVSPDGTKIAFVSNRSGTWTIWTMDINGSNLVNTGVAGRSPQWSQDSQKLWYSARYNHPNYQLNASSYVIHRMNPDGSGVERKSGYIEYMSDRMYPPSRTTWIDWVGVFAEQNAGRFSLAPDEKRVAAAMARQDGTINQSYVVIALDPDLDATTGVVHLLSQDNQDWSDFQLLAEHTGTGTAFEVASIPAEFAHLLIVVYATFDGAGAAENLHLSLNNDEAAKYFTLVQSANSTVLARIESLAASGFLLPFATDATDPDAMASAMILLSDIQSNDNLKSMIALAGRAISYSTTLQHRYNYLASGYYNSLNPITQLRIRGETNLAFLAGTKISVYGLGAKGRFLAS